MPSLQVWICNSRDVLMDSPCHMHVLLCHTDSAMLLATHALRLMHMRPPVFVKLS